MFIHIRRVRRWQTAFLFVLGVARDRRWSSPVDSRRTRAGALCSHSDAKSRGSRMFIWKLQLFMGMVKSPGAWRRASALAGFDGGH
jgi:hypothetical protein